MKRLTYFHCYTEELWRGYEKNGLLRDNFGIRCMQSIHLSEDRLFNSILKKGGELYNYIKAIQRGEVEDVFGWNVFVD